MQKKTKNKAISEIIELGEGMQAELDGNLLKIKKDAEEAKKKLSYLIEIKENKIIIENKNPTKRDKKLIKTNAAHVRNMINGLQEKFVYKLQICSVHFPMNVAAQGDEVIIKNFLGEVKDRKAKILPGVEVKIEGDQVAVSSSDKESAGQTAANIETASKVRKKDRRIFQDGIFIVEKQKGRKRE